MRPRCDLMIDRQIASPIPVPFALVVKNASKIYSLSFAPRPGPVSSIHTSTPSGLENSDLTVSTRARSETEFHRFDGIDDQVEEDLLQLHAVGGDAREAVAQFDPQRHAVILQVGAVEHQDVVDQLVDVERDAAAPILALVCSPGPVASDAAAATRDTTEPDPSVRRVISASAQARSTWAA